MTTEAELRALLAEALPHLLCRCVYSAVLCDRCQLKARITAALAENDSDGWIKGSERLPEHGERVQIVCEDADGEPYRTVATYNNNEYGPFVRDGGRKARNVTHWQPLPPLPTERKV